MKNPPNFNNNKAKSKPKQNVKKRGYYYSSANINKRQEVKNRLNNQDKNYENNNIEEDFFPKQKNKNAMSKVNNSNFENGNII